MPKIKYFNVRLKPEYINSIECWDNNLDSIIIYKALNKLGSVRVYTNIGYWTVGKEDVVVVPKIKPTVFVLRNEAN